MHGGILARNLSLSLSLLSFSSFPLLSSFSLPPLAPWKVGGSCGLDFQKLLQIARQACSCVARLLLAVKASDRLLAQEDQNPWKAHDLTTRESREVAVSRIATMWLLVRSGSDPTSVVVAITVLAASEMP